MVDPVNLTNYELTRYGLEEYLLFSIAVAGKNATVMSSRLERVLQAVHLRVGSRNRNPFSALRKFDDAGYNLIHLLKNHGIGCYKLKSRGFLAVARSRLNLRWCSHSELEQLPSIGLKTSRLFILHTRKDARVACIDTHLLKWFKSLGYSNVPEVSPQSRKQYLHWENIFLNEADKRSRNPAELDLEIWNSYAVKTDQTTPLEVP